MRRDVPDLQLAAPGERTRDEEGGGWIKEEEEKEMNEGRWERRWGEIVSSRKHQGHNRQISVKQYCNHKTHVFIPSDL